MNRYLREKKNLDGSSLVLVQGDITLAEVDAIVNPANQQLQHGGGLAGLLSKKAGPSLQSTSNLWVRENGPVSHHRPAHTPAGDLPFKAVIHAVGPVWGSGDEKNKLKQAVQGSLSLAEELDLRSLALPAISTGVFGYPLEEASLVILGAIDDYQSQGSSKLQLVEVVLFNDLAVQAFTAAWDQLFQ